MVIDYDLQATASEWGTWRQNALPEVINSYPPRLGKAAAARKAVAPAIAPNRAANCHVSEMAIETVDNIRNLYERSRR